jgi:hypothetical protein
MKDFLEKYDMCKNITVEYVLYLLMEDNVEILDKLIKESDNFTEFHKSLRTSDSNTLQAMWQLFYDSEVVYKQFFEHFYGN